MKRVHVYKDSKANFETFLRKCAKNYDLTSEQLVAIISIFKLADAHKQSPFEFTKKDKLIIMSNNLGIETLTVEKIKYHIIVTKDFLTKARYRIKNRL